MKNIENNWEIEFDKKIDNAEFNIASVTVFDVKKVKSFIRQLLQNRDREIVEMIEQLKRKGPRNVKDYKIHYDALENIINKLTNKDA